VTKQELENIRLEARKPKSYTDEYGNKHESHSVHIKADKCHHMKKLYIILVVFYNKYCANGIKVF
jgi:hypothetical protein